MPRKAYAKKRPMKKKAYKKRASKMTTVNRGISPIASRYIVKLAYAESPSITNAAGLNNSYVFRLNGLFDPNQTGVGHQPYGFDQLSLLYNRYRVYKTSWVVSARPSGSAGMMAVVPCNNTTSLAGDSTWLQEIPRGKTRQLSLDSPTRITGSISLPVLMGATSIEYKGDDRVSALVSADPTEIMTLQVVLNAVSSITVTFDVKIVYHVEFYDPIAQSQS